MNNSLNEELTIHEQVFSDVLVNSSTLFSHSTDIVELKKLNFSVYVECESS